METDPEKVGTRTHSPAQGTTGTTGTTTGTTGTTGTTVTTGTTGTTGTTEMSKDQKKEVNLSSQGSFSGQISGQGSTDTTIEPMGIPDDAPLSTVLPTLCPGKTVAIVQDWIQYLSKEQFQTVGEIRNLDERTLGELQPAALRGVLRSLKDPTPSLAAQAQQIEEFEAKNPTWWKSEPHGWPDETPISLALIEVAVRAKWDEDKAKKLIPYVMSDLKVSTVEDVRDMSEPKLRKIKRDAQPYLSKLRVPPDQQPISEDLLIYLIKLGSPHQDVQRSIVERALKSFSPRIGLILQMGDAAAALKLYEEVAQLPQTETEVQLELEGIQMGGNLYQNIFLCFVSKGTLPKCLKVLEGKESGRMKLLASKKIQHNHIIEFDLMEKGRHTFALMPFLPSTLEFLLSLPDSEVPRFWSQMEGALEYLHSHQVAHMDVKPGNIGIGHDGNFILIDLGSCVEFGRTTDTTPAFIPVGVTRTGGASSDLDWWMLAATFSNKSEHRFQVAGELKPADRLLAEKGRLPETPQKLGWGKGANNATATDLVMFLSKYHKSIEEALGKKVDIISTIKPRKVLDFGRIQEEEQKRSTMREQD